MAEIIWFDSIDSTNNEASRRLDTLDNMAVLAATEQTAGRGQGEHKWHSKTGENLTFSVVLKFGRQGGLPSLLVSDALLITELTTMALREYLLGKGISSRIKWHNDIYVGDGKICGILIENVLKGNEISSSIIGIGIDVNQTEFPSDLPNPVSIAQITGRKYDIKEELSLLCAEIEKCAALTGSAEGRKRLDEYFRTHCFNIPEGI